MLHKVRIYSRFERLWHWSQAALIISMGATGFEIHGTYYLLGFERAVEFHTTAAWGLIGLWAFAIFWHLTTGQWQHYIPTREKLLAVTRFYAIDLFRGELHPYERTDHRKLNPLQRLAYLFFKLVMAPMLWITGLCYMFFNNWETWMLAPYLDLGTVATIHLAGAFLITGFLVIHVYMTTLGHSVFEHIRSMITGWEMVEEDKVVQATVQQAKLTEK